MLDRAAISGSWFASWSIRKDEPRAETWWPIALDGSRAEARCVQ